MPIIIACNLLTKANQTCTSRKGVELFKKLVYEGGGGITILEDDVRVNASSSIPAKISIQLDLLNYFLAGCNVKMIHLARMRGRFFICFINKNGVILRRLIRRLIKLTTGI